MNVYDFDNTIYRGDSTFDFYIFCLKRHKDIAKRFPELASAFFGYKVTKTKTLTEMKTVMYRFLSHIDAKKDLDDFWQTHKQNIKEWYYVKQREDDVIISASPYFILEPICKQLGIKYLIASQVDLKTGEYTGVNCSGEEKVKRFREQFGDAVIDEFYSDSYSDMPLAMIAKKSMRIKGDKFVKW